MGHYLSEEIRIANRKETNRKYKANNKHKTKAQDALLQAVRMKRIIPQPCELCNVLETEAHHQDYNKPYDVNWLCIFHHKLIHVAIRKLIKITRLRSKLVNLTGPRRKAAESMAH